MVDGVCTVILCILVCACVYVYVEHIGRALLDRIIAAMQAGHQKHMFTLVCHVCVRE